MASPTWAELSSQIRNAIKARTDLEAHFPTQVTDEDTAIQSAEGDVLGPVLAAESARHRAAVSAAINWPGLKRVADAWAFEVMRLAGQPTDDLWGRVHRYMHEQSKTFNDADWTRGTPSAVSGTGTGVLKRLTVDWEGYNLQGGHVETKRFECIVDQNLGVRSGEEVFRCAGEDRSKDNLDYQGSGLAVPIPSMHSGGSGGGRSYLQNSSWDSTFVGSGTDKISGWTIGGTAAKITAGTSGFRTAPGSSAQGTLVFDNDSAATNEVTQALSVRRLTAFGERTPWMLSVAYKKSSAGATGTLNLKMGSKTTALDLSTIGDTNWHQLFFTIDKNVYYRNWAEVAPDIEVEVVNLSAGTLTLDDLSFAPWVFIDGTGWWMQGGATAFIQRDFITAADSGPTAATSEVRYALARCGVLPMGTAAFEILNIPVATAAGESETDP